MLSLQDGIVFKIGLFSWGTFPGNIPTKQSLKSEDRIQKKFASEMVLRNSPQTVVHVGGG